MTTVPGASVVLKATTARRSRSGTAPSSGVITSSVGKLSGWVEAKPRLCALAEPGSASGASIRTEAKTSALATRDGDRRLAAKDCVMKGPVRDAHHVMLCPVNTLGAPQFRPARPQSRTVKPRPAHTSAMELSRRGDVMPVEFKSRATLFLSRHCRLARGRTIVSVAPSKPVPAKPVSAKPLSDDRGKTQPGDRQPSKAPEGTPLPDSKAELPPVIRRAEVVAFALVALLIICVVAVLYVAKGFFLPITMAFIIGTMLSPAASLMERYRIPRAVAAVLIVIAVGTTVTFMLGLIASPAMEWSNNLPELGARLKEKAHLFDRPLVLWQQLQSMLGGSSTLATFEMPKFEWVQPTVEFLTPTFTEFLLFIPTLILFIASWRELRRAMIM